jgi:hypothetical protein
MNYITRRATPHSNGSDLAKWFPSATGVAKINVDVALAKTGNKGAAAAFCRDHNGVYLGASVVVFMGITDPTTLEALACRESLALAEDLALAKIHVASDCSTVVSDIKEGSLGRVGSIITEIRSRAEDFGECSFVHERRASNFEAHNLARHMMLYGVGRHLWFDIPYSELFM